MSILDRCSAFTEARQAQKKGVYPYFHTTAGVRGTQVLLDGRWKLMAGSNNYLGLANHPEVLDAAASAVRRLGAGATGSRLLNGSIDIHEELEDRLARFLGKPDAMIFPTGYQANLGTLAALLGRRDHAYLDRLNHACLTDGARLGLGRTHRYDHGDDADLRRQLASAPPGAETIIATDGVFSMDGDVAPLPALVRVAGEFGAAIMLDDAHALGVLGHNGAGTAEHFGLTDHVDLIMVTFSKALGSVGGVLVGPEDVLHYLRHRARPFVFSAALPPPSAAAALKALEILQREPERRARLWEATRLLRAGLTREGFDLGVSETPILPVHVGDYATVLAFWRSLYDEDVYVNAVVPPGVPPGSARLRVTLTADFSDEDVGRVVDAFVRVRARLQDLHHDPRSLT